MFNFSKTYTYFNEDRIASESGVVVLLKTQTSEFKGKKFIACALMIASVGILSLQAGFVLNANAEGNPISSPVSTQESPLPRPTPSTIQCPVGKIAKVVDSTIICVSQSQEQNQSQTQNNNQNQSVNATGGTSSSSASSPITSPEVSPSPSANPITSPEVTPSPTPSSQPSNNSGNEQSSSSNNGGGSSSNGSSPSAPSCNNEAPKAPKIISATSAAKNEVTLNWEKAQGNVTHYAISYGLMPGKPLYGNPNIGNVASFTVKGLSAGTTYYFQVNAVNGCTGGPASNEIGIKGGGKFINSPAQGFKASGVLGKSTQVKYAAKSASGKPALAKPVVFNNANIYSQSNVGLVGKVFSFFKGLFN